MALTDKQADRLFDAMLTRVENKLARKMRVNFSKLSREIIEQLKANGEIAAESAIINNAAVIERILFEAYQEGIINGVRLTRRDLDLDTEHDTESMEEVLLLLLLWSRSTAKEEARLITKTTLNIFQEAMIDANAMGLVGGKAAKFLKREFRKDNAHRIMAIATTEAGIAISAGQEKMAILLAAQILKSWRSQEDLRVRETHVVANRFYRENPIELGMNFKVGIGSGPYPRARSLPASEKIRCRCYLRFAFA